MKEISNMYKIKEDEMNVPCYVWAEKESIEKGTIGQIKNASSLPFAYHNTVLCPDAHLGYGAPIGGVLATEGVVIPNFVGVDIGCGMIAVKTSLTELDTETIKKIMGGGKENHGGIRSRIPVGRNSHSKKQDYSLMPDGGVVIGYPIISQEFNNALKQIGTLGGGNHFIEIQKGDDGYIWIMIHSGSRNLGYKVAKHYNNLAIELNDKWFSKVNKKWELAFLPTDSKEGQDYINEMEYCVEFALENRNLMMENVKKSIRDIVSGVTFNESINIAHNYASLENHFGKNVWVHRKGATQARLGQLGIIPGSQGTKSYIVKGKGNLESFTSCSHGSGRKLSRTRAIKELNLKSEIDKMDKQGIIHSVRSKRDLDESPGAYKDIEEVMRNQTDLVDIEVELKPLAVIKG